MIKPILLASLALAISGCAAQVAAPESDHHVLVYKKFNAPLNTNLTVETGEHLFVEGSYIEGENIKISSPTNMSIPGFLSVNFPVSFQPGDLKLARVTTGWKYYCADPANVAASYNGHSVMAAGDCAGIRTPATGGAWQWFVDNSQHNHATYTQTIWSKDMERSEQQRFTVEKSNTPFKATGLKRITFNGYYGGQLHFSWTEVSGDKTDAKEFVFDFKGPSTTVGIKGNLFEVHSADNVRLVYSWISFK